MQLSRPSAYVLIQAARSDRPRLRMAWLAGRTSLELRRRGLGAVLERIDLTHPPARIDTTIELAERLDHAFELLPLRPTCLRRSATLLRELDRRGETAELVIGVRSVSGQTEAHAWVEIEQVVVNDDPEQTSTYRVIATGSELGTLPSGLR